LPRGSLHCTPYDQQDSRYDPEMETSWENKELTESLQPPESSIDIDMTAVPVAAMADVVVDIDRPITADGVGICSVISIFVARLRSEEPKFLVESMDTVQDTAVLGLNY
jgi:hypothetical protein